MNFISVLLYKCRLCEKNVVSWCFENNISNSMGVFTHRCFLGCASCTHMSCWSSCNWQCFWRASGRERFAPALATEFLQSKVVGTWDFLPLSLLALLTCDLRHLCNLNHFIRWDFLKKAFVFSGSLVTGEITYLVNEFLKYSFNLLAGMTAVLSAVGSVIP